MKDVNDLMHAILEMDAAQRKASQKAREERAAKLAELDAHKRSIAAESDAKEKAAVQAAEKAAEQANADALSDLEKRRAEVSAAMQAAAETNRAAWSAELVRRALGEGLQ